MQSLSPAPNAAPYVKVAVRSSGGDGSRVFVVDAPACGTIADVKRLLCCPPHSMCRDESALLLVLKGEGAAVAICSQFELNLMLSHSGSILHDDAVVSSASTMDASFVTVISLVSVSPNSEVQPQATAAARPPPPAPSVSAPTASDVTKDDASGPSHSHATSAAAAAVPSDESAPSLSSPAKFSSHSPAPAAACVQPGSLVRIEGLQSKPQHNGRTGIVCGALDQESGRCTVEVDASDAGPSFQISIRPANLTLLPATHPLQCQSAPLTSGNTVTPPAQAVEQGSRVRIEGLQAKPHMNGRTGVVQGAFNQESERWTVDLAADGARPACRGSFRAANLRLIPSHDFNTQWVDESGRVWPKNVEFSRQCAKGHALAPLGERCGLAGMRLMCRLCHCFCRRDCEEAANWLICAVDAGCCGQYAVCCSCAPSPCAAAAVCAGSDNFRTLVSCSVEYVVRGLMFCVAGCGSAVSVLAAVDAGLIAGLHDNVSVLSNVRATVHVVQPRQRDAASDGAERHCTPCWSSDVVHQPHVEQRVRRHA